MHIGDCGSHLPDDQIAGACHKSLSYSIELHLTAAAEDVAVIIVLIGIRIFPVP